MAFTTWVYGLLITTSTAVYWMLPRLIKEYFLLAVSILFVLYSSPTTAVLLLGLGTLVYAIGQKAVGKKTLLLAGLIVLLSVLVYFKYVVLLNEIIYKALPWTGYELTFDIPKYVLPLGISYFSFKLIHYLVDSYRGASPKGTYIRFLLYIFFFPILPLGPIERWQNFLHQTEEPREFKWEYLTAGLGRILTGLFKKLVLADGFAIVAEKLGSQGLSSFAYWMVVYAYAFQIYFDFSGYSDIAIGSARLFGYRIIENFDNPYLKSNLSKFWKSWHMSLTGWFRDYVFIPLGGSRGSFIKTSVNTLIVMSLTGVWHGASFNFIVWGIYHGIGLILLRIYGITIGNRLPEYWRNSRLSFVVGTLVTFHFVIIGWIFFATDFDQSLYVISKMFKWG